MTVAGTMVLLSFVAGVVVAQTGAPAKFSAEAVTRTGHLTFEAPAIKLFPLFTPEGERHWAAGWNPEILYPHGSETVEGMLFRTEDHGGMVWWVTRYDAASFAISYNLSAPGALARRIQIRCRATGNRTEVDVTDTYIGLSEQGNEFVRSLDEKAYAAKMAGWQHRIGHYLATGETLPAH